MAYFGGWSKVRPFLTNIGMFCLIAFIPLGLLVAKFFDMFKGFTVSMLLFGIFALVGKIVMEYDKYFFRTYSDYIKAITDGIEQSLNEKQLKLFQEDKSKYVAEETYIEIVDSKLLGLTYDYEKLIVGIKEKLGRKILQCERINYHCEEIIHGLTTSELPVNKLTGFPR